MDWLVLVASGGLEAVWASALGRSDGFKRLWPTLVFLVANVISMIGLEYAMRTIPVGTAYAVWVSIGTVLTTAWAMGTRQERATVAKVALLGIIVACVVGLKVTG